MQKIGLTGNIGSGKSLVAQIFKTFDIPVFEADVEAKTILYSPEVSKKVVQIFGYGILVDGSISRKKLANLAFNNPALLQKLNNIIHPAVKQKFKQWAELHISKPYIIYEAAILFESGQYKEFDRIITVFADPETRIQRVMQRDEVSRKLVLERMKNQWPDEKKNALADFVISNNNEDLLIPQVENIHLKLSSSR
ncbi:MAG: dephospho-CoA kinase [Bacteroidetes bacterium 4572_114]|nr:MAG: dephospho-CoA kinase [Bacteroidetes bacterium 4572_114]